MIRTKEKSLSVLIKEADEVFRDFIQKRDEGKACFICGAPMGKDREVCHYVRRQHLVTRWSVINSNMGCLSCNRFDQQHEKKYREKLVLVYGSSAINNLEIMSRSLLKPMRSDVTDLIADFKIRIKNL